MSTELTVALLPGLFGLVPLIVQIATTRAQRRDRMTRLNQLRAELELLERLHTLQGKVGATDEAAKLQSNRVINDALSRVLAQYNELSKIAPSAVVGGKQPSTQHLTFLRRAFLLYNPLTISGWILHTLFYIMAFILVPFSLYAVLFWTIGNLVEGALFFAIPFGTLLLITQRLARRDAAHNAARLEEPES